MEILTRELIALAEIINMTSDSNQVITWDLARGNAAVINGFRLAVHPRVLTTLTSNESAEGRIALALDSALLAVTDILDQATQEDDDVGEGRGLLEQLAYSFQKSAQQDTTNNNASAVLNARAMGMDVNYRALPLDNRAMTTENPELLVRATNTGFAVNAFLQIYYQIVRLDSRELARLSADIRPSVVRVASIPENGAMVQRTYL